MKMNQYLYYLLMRINKSQLTSLDDEIAMILVENQNELSQKSLRSIADENYISQSAMSKFLKKNSITYKDLQNNSIEMKMIYNQQIDLVKQQLDGLTLEEIRESVIQKQKANIEMLRIIDLDQVKREAEEIKRFKRVIFIGSDFSMSIINFIQTTLTSSGIICYTMYDPLGQKNMIERLDKDDLVITVSIKARWFTEHEAVRNALFASPCAKILWTVMQKHPQEDQFDDVFRFGRPVNEYSYTQLSCFCPLFAHIFIKSEEEQAIKC